MKPYFSNAFGIARNANQQGRTVELHCEDGSYLIKAVGRPVKKI